MSAFTGRSSRFCSRFPGISTGLFLLAAAIAAGQTVPASKTPGSMAKSTEAPNPESASAVAADKAKDTPAAPPKPAPVIYTELKKTLWPPKAGVKAPGVQIPITYLKPEAEIALGAPAGEFLFTTDQLLIPIPSKDQIVRVEGRSNKMLEPFSGITKPCGGLTTAFRNLWVVSCGGQTLARLETATGKSVASISTGSGNAATAVASSADSVWMLADDKTTVLRIDPEMNSVVSEFRLAASCKSLTSADSSLWAVCPGDKRIIRINPQTNLVIARIEVTPEPISIAFGGATAAESSIWVLSKAQGKVARIDPKTNKVIATIDLGFTNADGSIAFGDGFVWVSAPGFPITKISTPLEKEKVVQQFAGDGGGVIHFGLNSVWLTNTAYNNVWRIDPKRIAATLAE